MSIHPAPKKKKKKPIKHTQRNYIVEIHEQQNKIAFPSKNKQITNKIARPYLSLCETVHVVGLVAQVIRTHVIL